ncbi:UNVERIFIED_CONTAM: hypothetical protein Sradi_7130300 [Sesamum radiatum]|uniref:Reverse transcriptase domain-containing protein n=1 Tax=Sesamum radiatum TaxID=300843 RepID=A0AAW2IXK7_SESRA
MAEFRAFILAAALVHLLFTGCPCTWHNCSEWSRSLWRRLDRVLVNDTWLDVWPHSSYLSALPQTSDHSPLVLLGAERRIDRGVFKFDNYLVTQPSFIPSVQQVWNHRIVGTKMYEVTRKLKALKPVFRAQRKLKGDLSNNVLRAQQFLVQAQSLFDTFKEDILMHLVQWCRMIYCRAVDMDDKMLRQRTKFNWLQQGDRCTKVFFRRINVTRATMRVYQISNATGDTLTDTEHVVAEFVTYFEALLGGERQPCNLNLDFLQPHLKHTLTVEEAAALLRQVSTGEVKEALFAISEDSAPGPDGYTSAFFKSAWTKIGEDICAAVQEFFLSGKLLKQINTTLLVLIPKVQLPTRVMQFRPIACCNVLYKIISKILVSRMQRVLDSLIDYSQNAFIPGRSIADNVLLAQELLLGYNQTKLPQRCTIKVDIQKAYDSVLWDFLFEMLRIFKFPMQFIGWVQRCVTTTAYSIALNGEVASVRLVKEVLEEFGVLSGLQVNPNKSTIILSRAVQRDRQQILNISGFQEGRVQLLKSVLGALHVYWLSVFVLPKAIVKVIEQQMRSFLWKGVAGSGLAKVSWEQVSKAKEEGGLGIRRVLHMNNALILKHVWRILQQDSSSIWVAWVLRHRLRNQSIWTVNVTTASWCWRKIVKVSRLFKEGLAYEVGDGCKFRLWTDLWHPASPLIKSFPRGPLITGLPSDSYLQTVIHNGQWCWPSASHFDIQQIVAALPAIHLNQSDRIVWTAGTFSTHSVFALLQPVSSSVHWHQLIGGKFCIPRHDFIRWLAILERLSTLDRIWAPATGQGCVLCGGQQGESHLHLFFHCSYTRFCLSFLKRQARFQWPNRGWQYDILWAARRWRGCHLLNEASRSLLASFVYHVWCERNNRIFTATAESSELVAFRALDDVRLRIIAANLKPSLQRMVLYRIWHIPWP